MSLVHSGNARHSIRFSSQLVTAFNVWIEDNNSMDKTMASIGNAFDNINKVKSFIRKR